MGLFRRRPRPEKCGYDCRHLDAYRSAAGRASARGVRVDRLTEEVRERDARVAKLCDELAAANTTIDELLRDATARVAAGLPQWRGSDGSGLAARAVEAERRSTAATQRAELAEKRADRLDDLLTVERLRREDLERQLATGAAPVFVRAAAL